MLWYSGEHSGEYDDRSTISYTAFCDEITEPEEDHGTCCDKEHGRKYHSGEVLRIDDRRTSDSGTDDTIEKVDHTIALCES